MLKKAEYFDVIILGKCLKKKIVFWSNKRVMLQLSTCSNVTKCKREEKGNVIVNTLEKIHVISVIIYVLTYSKSVKHEISLIYVCHDEKSTVFWCNHLGKVSKNKKSIVFWSNKRVRLQLSTCSNVNKV